MNTKNSVSNYMPMPFPPPPFPPIPPPNLQTQSGYGAWQASGPPPPFPWPRHHGFGPSPWTMPPYLHPGSNIQHSTHSQVKAAPIETQEETDKKWLKSFIQNHKCAQKKEDVEDKARKDLKISEAKSLHKRAHFLVKTLSEMGEANSEENCELKTELDNILSILTDENTLTNLTAKLKKREKKREREKKKRVTYAVEKQDREKKLKAKHEEMDRWLQKRFETEQNRKREMQVQRELDLYLHEIRQKQAGLQKSLDLINGLAKLRKARKESTTHAELKPSDTQEEIFLTAHREVRDGLLSKLSSCKEEEKSLSRFLLEEHKAEEERIKKQKLRDEDEKRDKWNKTRREILFGCSEKFVSDPMMTQELHEQASSSLLSLANTRQLWDQFVADTGTRIPKRWVEPVAPSSSEWRQFCEDSPAED